MSKKSRSRRGITQHKITTANHRLPTTSPLNSWSMSDYNMTLEDRRTYHPDGPVRSPRSITSSYPTYIAAPKPRNDPWAATPPGIAFDAPNDVLICVRRKQRKEVLHALKKTGKTGQKRPHRNPYSNVHC